MQEKTELNLNNPIFAVYVNVCGLSRQRVEETMQHLSKTMDCHSNVTMWFFAIGSQGGNQETRIECIYEGRNRDMELSDLTKAIDTRVDILSNSKSFDDFKLKVRDWRLETVLKNGDNEK
jgi:hypothetical protein